MSNYRHGHARQGAQTPEYRTWANMIRRCQDPSVDGYERYGGRGIRVCRAWTRAFSAFLQDVGRRPSPRHSIDRIDVNGHYEPGNVRWSTSGDQARNRRSNIVVEFRGQRMCLKDAAALAGIKYRTVWMRIRSGGWTAERALTEPVGG